MRTAAAALVAPPPRPPGRRRPARGEAGVEGPRATSSSWRAPPSRWTPRSRCAARRPSRSAEGEILAVGDPAAIDAAYQPKERIVRAGGVLLPGFVNTHTHAAMNLLRGISNDQPLMEWLTKFIFPAEAKNVSPAFVKAGTDLACLEMIRGGTTTFADMYYYESDVAASVDKAGLRGRPRRDVARLPGAGPREPRGVEEGHARLPREVEGAPARHGGHRPARPLHVQPGDAPGGPGARRRVRRARS